jgi:STE24 endopeptidase
VVVAALAAGALLLLPSAVPDDLHLGHVDVGQVFGVHTVARAARYERFLAVDWVLSQITLLVVLAVYARRGIGYIRESAAGPIGTGMLLGMLGLAFVWLAGLPFRLASHWWDRRYGLTHVDYLSWVFQDWAVLAAEFVSICVALLVVMGLARRLHERWWLPGAAVFVAIGALFTFVSPYLDYSTKPLHDQRLLAAARRFEADQGLGNVPIRVEKVSDDTQQANAYSWGLGPSRQVVLWDTILQPPFTKAEQKVVLAHELGHQSSEHIPKGIAWFAIFAIPGAWILMRATRRRGGMGRPEAIPLALLVVAVLQLAALPAQNWISRRMEAEADWKALESTKDPGAMRRLMVSFAASSVVDPSPPTWEDVMLGTHPTLEQRVAMAQAWAARNGR